jgi:hypothetical protein
VVKLNQKGLLFTGNIQLDNIFRLFLGNRLYWIGFPSFFAKINRLYLDKIDRQKQRTIKKRALTDAKGFNLENVDIQPSLQSISYLPNPYL